MFAPANRWRNSAATRTIHAGESRNPLPTRAPGMCLMSIENVGDDSSGRGWKQRLSWLRNEPEAGIALLIAVGAAVVDLLDGPAKLDKPSIVAPATLVVLALV